MKLTKNLIKFPKITRFNAKICKQIWVYLFDVEVVHEHTRVITELVRSDGG